MILYSKETLECLHKVFVTYSRRFSCLRRENTTRHQFPRTLYRYFRVRHQNGCRDQRRRGPVPGRGTCKHASPSPAPSRPSYERKGRRCQKLTLISTPASTRTTGRGRPRRPRERSTPVDEPTKESYSHHREDQPTKAKLLSGSLRGTQATQTSEWIF